MPDNSVIEVIEKAESRSSENLTVDDKLAQAEKLNKFNDNIRGESYRKHIHRIVVWGMYALGIMMIALTIIRLWHFVAPENLRWLSDTDTHSIERIIFSGIILSLASKYFKHYKLIDEG